MTTTLQEKAMLYILSIKQWSGKATDKRASQQIAGQNNADASAIRTNKTLVFSDLTDRARKLGAEVRNQFYQITLPWYDDGRRLGSAAGYMDIMTKIGAYKAQFETLVSRIEAEYPQMKAEAQSHLGGLYKEEDYPDDIASKYSFVFRCEPVPSVSDIRAEISDEQKNQIKAEMKAQLEAAEIAAKKDIYTRAGECVKRIADTLKNYNPDKTGKEKGSFKCTMITNLQDLIGNFGLLNFTNDEALESLKRQLETLTTNSAETLKKCAIARTDTARNAESILASMCGYFQPPVQMKTPMTASSSSEPEESWKDKKIREEEERALSAAGRKTA